MQQFSGPAFNKVALKNATMKTKNVIFIMLIAAASTAAQVSAQSSDYYGRTGKNIEFGLHFDPVIGWFGSDNKEVWNQGARPGYDLGLTFNKFFGDNYAFSTGISLINAGGKLVSSQTTVMDYANFDATVLPGKTIVYKINYLSFPVGLKLQTNEIGYMTYYTNVGFDPKFVIGGKNNIPSLNIKNESADNELRLFNLSWHIAAGIEYSVGGNTAFIMGLRFENNFLDITKDNGSQPKDKITHKLLSVRLGIKF